MNDQNDDACPSCGSKKKYSANILGYPVTRCGSCNKARDIAFETPKVRGTKTPISCPDCGHHENIHVHPYFSFYNSIFVCGDCGFSWEIRLIDFNTNLLNDAVRTIHIEDNGHVILNSDDPNIKIKGFQWEIYKVFGNENHDKVVELTKHKGLGRLKVGDRGLYKASIVFYKAGSLFSNDPNDEITLHVIKWNRGFEYAINDVDSEFKFID